jgi:rifampin ADP-ribosylating transferase
VAASDGPDPRQFLHGTRADLGPGDLVVAGYRSNFGSRKKAGFVYLTRSLDAAVWGAALAVGEGPGRIYTVEPTGPVLDDPNLTEDGVNPTESYRSKEPLRVTGERTDWQPHPPETVKAMKDRIEGLDPLPGS